jgi:hypothetical protein
MDGKIAAALAMIGCACSPPKRPGAEMKLMLASLSVIGLVATAVPNVDMAQADQCVAQCRSAHNQCRLAARSYSSPQCDAQLQACIERCGKGR